MLKFVIKRGDTSPALRFALLPDSVSLAGATVRFQMRRAGWRDHHRPVGRDPKPV